MGSSTPASASTPPVRRTTTATAGSCSTSCGRCGAAPPDGYSLMDLGLGGRGYLLTGASRGLGFATARTLVDEGAQVLISSRSRRSINDAVVKLGGAPDAHGMVADLADPEAAGHLVHAALHERPSVDGVLISVGGPPPGSILETP